MLMRAKMTCTTLISDWIRSYEDFRDFSLEKGASVPPLLQKSDDCVHRGSDSLARMIRNIPLLFVHATFKMLEGGVGSCSS